MKKIILFLNLLLYNNYINSNNNKEFKNHLYEFLKKDYYIAEHYQGNICLYNQDREGSICLDDNEPSSPKSIVTITKIGNDVNSSGQEVIKILYTMNTRNIEEHTKFIQKFSEFINKKNMRYSEFCSMGSSSIIEKIKDLLNLGIRYGQIICYRSES